MLVGSQLAHSLDLCDLQSTRVPYDAITTYAKNKQAVRMLAAEAAAAGRGFAEKGVVVAACHPGIVTSTLLSNLGFAHGVHAPAVAAQTPLQLALGTKAPLSGKYHADKKQVDCPYAKDEYASARLPLDDSGSSSFMGINLDMRERASPASTASWERITGASWHGSPMSMARFPRTIGIQLKGSLACAASSMMTRSNGGNF